jgi:lactose/L-arabinose transport system permease protein
MEQIIELSKKKKNIRSLKRRTPYLFLAPFVIFFLVFMIYPIIYALVISFSKWQSGNFQFAGLFQYNNLIGDSVFWQSLGNVLIILVIQVPIMLILASIFAALLNSKRLKFKSLFQLGFFLPLLIDSVAYSLTFSFIFADNGLVNDLLGVVGIHPIEWLLNPFWAKIAIIVAVTWHWTGYNIVILLGGLQSIPDEVYEAAKMDGATSIRQWFSITLPMLRPLLILESILSIIGTIQLFTEPFIITGGGPGNSTLSPVLYLYNVGFQQFNFSYASAIAYALAIIIAIFSFFQFRFTKGGEVDA